MADSPLAYDLRAPAAARGESITSQLQRELLRDATAFSARADDENRGQESDASGDAAPLAVQMRIHEQTAVAQPATPAAGKEGADENDLIAISTPESLSQKDDQQKPPTAKPTATATSSGRDDRRRTLSPSKALAFFSQEGITDSLLSSSSTRRDTVSPEAIRSLLQGLDESGGSRRASVAAALGLDPANNSIDEGMLSEYLHDVARTKQYLESSKLALLQTTPKTKRRRRSVAAAKTATAGEQDSFTDAFFSSTLLSRDGDDDDDNTIDSVSGGAAARRTTLEPMDAQSILAELRSEMDGAAPDEHAALASRATTTTHQQSPNTRSSRKRRATLDPVDLIAMRDGAAAGSAVAAVTANRRETIGDGDLMELRREFGVDAGDDDEPESSRKRKPTKSPSPAKRDTPTKRTRFDDDSAAAATHTRTTKSTPAKTSKAPAAASDDPLFSPPPTNRTNKTPLKSCLSARKASKRDQTTPNKSVNFGPSQGAEFNLGSPSTSMTPLPARDARVMFPLHEKSPPASEDDEETSLNTSILDEADGRDSSEEEDQAMVLDQRKLSIEPSVSTRTRRRYSLRGVSPLDNQANARRQRRLSSTSGAAQPQSPLVSARNRRAFEAAAAAAQAAAASAAAPPRPSGLAKTSFLSATEPPPQSRSAYADSSASSDEGEDMEITGDFSNHAATASTLQTGVRQSRLSESPRLSVRKSARQDSLFVDSPLSDTTIELGTLRDLVNETYEEEKKEESTGSDMSEDDDDGLQMGSLGDLAREAEEEEEGSQRLSVSKFAASQDKDLHPIVEGDDEDRRSSSAHSMMSLDSDDESDDEYNAKRKSLVVNLSSKFERFGSGTPKNRKQNDHSNQSSAASLKKRLPGVASPQATTSASRALPSPSPPKLPDPLRSEEVLARVEFAEIMKEKVDSIDVFESLASAVQRSCVAQATVSDLRFSTNEMASWCSGLSDGRASVAQEKVSRVFSTDDPATLSRINESIQALHAVESVHVRSGYCQWRAKMEKRICDSLVQCEHDLTSDVKALRSMLESDRSHRESELRAIKELMERERQMEQLLDGIEEQQSVQREYQSSVQSLESECSSLSLKASVLDQQLVALDQSSPQTDRSLTTDTQLRQDVLELEEILAVRESVGLWRVHSATGSKLAVVARYDDVLFSIDVRVTIDTTGTRGQSSFKVAPTFTTKTRRRKAGATEPPHQHVEEDDAVSTIAATILSPSQLQEYESTSIEITKLSKHLTALSTSLRRTFQYLAELRSISTQCALRIEATDEERKLWIDFVRFPRTLASGATTDGLKFSVGHRLEASWPFTNVSLQVGITYGAVTEQKIRQQLDEVSTESGHEYLMRLCHRLRDVFIQDV